jgi:EAL domain-containing protein (putative c-di-GMP-specific phosphodiesterase class I)
MTDMAVQREGRAFSALENGVFDAQALLVGKPEVREYPRARHSVRPSVNPRLSPSALLRNAMERHELSLYYQPQFEICSGQCCGVEALARWFLPNGDSISPLIFVAAAEKNGLIAALGAWVLREACTTVATWRRGGAPPPTLCVNVSPRQISREFSAVLASTLERTGFPAAQLELEITEGILIRKPELALDCLAQWKELGVRVALDDFGTGYSSLSYLSRMPVDRIKIDKSLIHRMASDSKTAAIVRAVIALGADLGCAVLAEGVESEAQLTMLNDMGCRQVQGYLLALPVCANEARALLAANSRIRPIPNIYPAARSATVSLNAS